MAWGTIPTAAGQLKFAKGRLRKFADALEEGAHLPGHALAREVSDPGGLTARMKNGTKVLAYRRVAGTYGARAEARYAVIGADGVVVCRDLYSVSAAIGRALGGSREFEVGPAGKVTVSLTHKSSTNRLTVTVSVAAPNPNAEWVEQATVTAYGSTKDQDAVWLAVNVLTDHGFIEPLLDEVQEVCPHNNMLPRAVGLLYAEPVPPERLKKREYRVVYDPGYEFQTRVLYLTGEPVDGPAGDWHKAVS